MLNGISRRAFLGLASGALFASTGSAGQAQKDNVPAVLDHILLGCADLQRGIDFVEEHTGVRAAFGGVHPGRGTQNALLSLGDRHYLEIIALDPKQSGAPDLYGLRTLVQPKLVSWAAHPGRLTEFAGRLTQEGIAFEGPTPGTRKRPDGRLLEWSTLNLKDDAGGLLPFFIEWKAGSTHPSADAPGGCQLLRFEIASPDPASLRKLTLQFGLHVRIRESRIPQLCATVAGPHGELPLPS
ncbi:MAG TPA: VOC family protein [Candidatus Acidoferrum sp.]|jgi:catechol 2,3-dioxygenase-like lactoylglutathione lyase family enzyme|nr:VOC family protein [Candidatus Acidoferrum sp.]